MWPVAGLAGETCAAGIGAWRRWRTLVGIPGQARGGLGAQCGDGPPPSPANAQVSTQDAVLLPANVSHALLETVKRTRAEIRFGDLTHMLSLCAEYPVRIAWAEPVLGLPTGIDARAELTILDHSDTLPQGTGQPIGQTAQADVTIFGLQLSTDAEEAGTVLVFRDAALAARVAANMTGIDRVDDRLALAQLTRLRQLAPRQSASLALVYTGVLEAAGLPVMTPRAAGALARGIAVSIPAECAPSTFVTYARRELTRVAWLPELRPVHFAAAAHAERTAANLERWTLLPVLPEDDELTSKQTVLGIVKTAEYLGVRWRTNPARAAQYAKLLEQMYGLDHDAYRPVFEIGAHESKDPALDPMDLFAPTCKLGKVGADARQAALVKVGA
ncbi:MAG: hypothetical protein IPK16_24815 [Anaerolineales bacterium]|nr:hypothetical protein [Anaerolineales bacterium]